MDIKEIKVKCYEDYEKIILENIQIIKAGILRLEETSDSGEEFEILVLNITQILKIEISDVCQAYLKYFDYDTDEYKYTDEMNDLIRKLKNILEYKHLSDEESTALTAYKFIDKISSTGYLLKNVMFVESFFYRGVAKNKRGVAYWTKISVTFPSDFEVKAILDRIKTDFITAMLSKARETNKDLKKYNVSFIGSLIHKKAESNVLILDFELSDSEYWRLEKLEVFDKSKEIRCSDSRQVNQFYGMGNHIHKVIFDRNSENNYRKWRIEYDYSGYHWNDWD